MVKIEGKSTSPRIDDHSTLADLRRRCLFVARADAARQHVQIFGPRRQWHRLPVRPSPAIAAVCAARITRRLVQAAAVCVLPLVKVDNRVQGPIRCRVYLHVIGGIGLAV